MLYWLNFPTLAPLVCLLISNVVRSFFTDQTVQRSCFFFILLLTQATTMESWKRIKLKMCQTYLLRYIFVGKSNTECKGTKWYCLGKEVNKRVNVCHYLYFSLLLPLFLMNHAAGIIFSLKEK